jgi:hypothetical protein
MIENPDLWGPHCFWYWLIENYPPNVMWCEEKVCSLVVTPFNTWTNLGYILGSLFVAVKVKDHTNALFRFYAQAMFWVGLSSLIYHASINFFTQIFDFFGMYMFCFLLIMLNLDRVGRWPKGKAGIQRFWTWVVGLTAFTSVALWINNKFPIQIFVLLLIFAILFTESRAPAPEDSPKRKYVWISTGLMVVAITFSILDATRTMCDPTNHWFQGHGMWHLTAALALLASFKHYSLVYKTGPNS